MNRKSLNILVTESANYSKEALAIYRTIGHVRTAECSRKDLLNLTADADVLVVRMRHLIDAELLSHTPRLRVIVSPTTGLTHIDQEAAAWHSVKILNLRGETAFLEKITPTAELTWGLILCLSRRLPEAFAQTGGGDWDRDALRGQALQDRTLGIVGLGRLGRMVANYGLAFRMRVLAFDSDSNVVVPPGVESVNFETVIGESDILSVHAALTDASIGFIDENAFNHMKKGVLFINTARGELVDEAALLKALQSRYVAAAALDVLSGEPFAGPGLPADHPLAAFARANPTRLLLTPHIGGATVDAMAATEIFMAEKLRRWLKTGEQTNLKETI